MITSIRLKNFKNFADETLRVGPFTILVGANASGKSNIRDAFRFLSGIGRGYTLAEIFGGKREAGWEPIRGAMNEIVRFGQPEFSSAPSSFFLKAKLKLNETEYHYSIEVGRFREMSEMSNNIPLGPFKMLKEELRAGSEVVYTTCPDPRTGPHTPLRVKYEGQESSIGTDQPVLTQYVMPSRTRRVLNDQHSMALREAFASMRFLELSPDRMREPAFPGATVLGDSGENLATALQEVCADLEQEVLAGWLQELTPMDVKNFEFPLDPSGRTYLTIREKNNRWVSASSASDGTLRFLAMLAALLSKNSPDLYFFEEIDTGIHPARQWLLLELIEKQAAKNNIQVITTTHSPDLLTFVNDSTFDHLSVVCRLEDSQDAIIRPVAELPNAKKLRTSQGGLGRLLTSRWMETTLAFTEDYDEAEDDS